jgi:uncharacterized membrane protein
MEPYFTQNFVFWLCFGVIGYLIVAIVSAARYKRTKPLQVGVGEMTAEATMAGLLWPFVFVWSYFDEDCK